MTEFEKQDIFTAKMIEDYRDNLYPQLSGFSRYFDWKVGTSPLYIITRAHAHEMIGTAQSMLQEYYDKYPHAMDDLPSHYTDDIWQMYRGYGEDAYIVSYLEQIDGELTNLLVMGVL